MSKFQSNIVAFIKSNGEATTADVAGFLRCGFNEARKVLKVMKRSGLVINGAGPATRHTWRALDDAGEIRAAA